MEIESIIDRGGGTDVKCNVNFFIVITIILWYNTEDIMKNVDSSSPVDFIKEAKTLWSRLQMEL